MCLDLNKCSEFDTHDDSWADLQGPRQQEGSDAINSLVDYLDNQDYGDGTSWMDHTTIVGFSECRERRC